MSKCWSKVLYFLCHSSLLRSLICLHRRKITSMEIHDMKIMLTKQSSLKGWRKSKAICQWGGKYLLGSVCIQIFFNHGISWTWRNARVGWGGLGHSFIELLRLTPFLLTVCRASLSSFWKLSFPNVFSYSGAGRFRLIYIEYLSPGELSE